MSIKAKLYVFILGIFIVGVGGTVYWNETTVENAVLEILKAKQEEAAKHATTNMQRVIDRMDYALEEIARGNFTRSVLLTPKDPQTLRYANSRFTEINNTLPETSGVSLIGSDGLVVASSNSEAVGTLDLKDRDYFKAAMQGKKSFSAPSLSRVTGKPSVMYAMPVVHDGKIQGVAYMTIDLSAVFAETSKLKSGQDGYAFIVDSKGIMLYHPDNSRIFVDTSKEDWAAPLWQGKSEGYFECDFAGAKWLVNYYTMPTTGWIVMLNAQDTDLLSSIIGIRNATLTTYGVLFLVIAFTVWFFTQWLGKAFAQGIAFAKRVEEGDFEARWNNTGNDELGKLAASLNLAFDKVANQAVWFRNLLNAIKAPIAVMGLDEKITFTNAAFEAVAGKSGAELQNKPCTCVGTDICGTENCSIRRLQRGESQTRFTREGRQFEVNSYHMQDKDRKNIGYIEVLSDITEQEVLKRQAAEAALQGKLTAAKQLEAVVEIISSASTELSDQIEHSEHGATEQAARVTETATAMNQMNSTVLEVARNASSAADLSLSTRTKAENGAAVVQQAVTSIQNVQTQSLALKDDMVILGENAQSISQIMGVISDIADQTNLLALNAAIEAARAGEAGRGFAVVADEVRKLAEKTMQSTTDVGNAIRAIQQSASKSMTQVDEAVKTIEDATALAGRSGDALAEIVQMVDNTADQVRAIATASEQQSASSEQINQSIMLVNTIAGDTAQAMNKAARAVEELSSQTQTLTRLIDDMKQG